jgi:hypothetical protein
MAPQVYDWTCSVCSFTWVLNAMGVPMDREEAAQIIGYPNCVNETYGLMSADCLITAFANQGFTARQAWVTYDQAYAVMSGTTGCINPVGMYHFMGCRGTDGAEAGSLWVANSAPGYRGVYDNLDRNTFNAFGPVQLIYLVP